MKIVLLLSLVISSFVFAGTGPCEQIKSACQNAGFVPGGVKQGVGLWADCVQPLIQGKAQPANAKKPLPTVDAALVSQCKTAHPKFGEGGKQ